MASADTDTTGPDTSTSSDDTQQASKKEARRAEKDARLAQRTAAREEKQADRDEAEERAPRRTSVERDDDTDTSPADARDPAQTVRRLLRDVGLWRNTAPEVDVVAGSDPTEETARGTLTGADLEGDPLTYRVVQQPSSGAVTVDATSGAFTYTPGVVAAQADSFAVAADDEMAGGVGVVVVSVNLAGVVMFDGVALGEGLPDALAKLGDMPVYQIAAPSQLWNAFDRGTDQLLAARPGRFNGVVLDGGSHVDATLGGNILVDIAAQLVTQVSPPGHTQAAGSVAVGWINDFYSGTTQGVYGLAGQALEVEHVAVTVLPARPAVT